MRVHRVRPEPVVRILHRPCSVSADERHIERIAAEDEVHHVDDAIAIFGLAREIMCHREQHRTVKKDPRRPPTPIALSSPLYLGASKGDCIMTEETNRRVIQRLIDCINDRQVSVMDELFHEDAVMDWLPQSRQPTLPHRGEGSVASGTAA